MSENQLAENILSFEAFKRELTEDIRRERINSGDGLRKTFARCMYMHTSENGSDDFVPLYLDKRVFGSRSAKIDGYYFDDSDDGTLYLVIADFHEFVEGPTLTKEIAKNYFRDLRNFIEFSLRNVLQDPYKDILEFSSLEYNLAELLRKDAEKEPQKREIQRIRLILLTDQAISGRFKFLDSDPIWEINSTSTDEYQDVLYECQEQIWGFERIYDLYKNGKDADPLVLGFSEYNLHFQQIAEGDGFRSYLGALPAEFLAAAYQQYGSKLLEGNVRSYLTQRSKVNKEIIKTIKTNPNQFFIFNNGIAATAKDLVFEGSRLMRATDLQIVNGGQTTATLAAAGYEGADLEGISVAIKLTEVLPSLDEESSQKLVENISKCANTQNTIKQADFTSNNPFHTQMERLSRQIVTDAVGGRTYGTYWFYERSRGSYEQQMLMKKESEKKAFLEKFPKKQKITKEDLARVHLAWGGSPDVVAKGSNFLYSKFIEGIQKEQKKRTPDNEYGENYFKETVALQIIWNKLSDTIKKNSTETRWFQGAYKNAIIPYTMALFAMLYRDEMNQDFDLAPVWKTQTVHDYVMNCLLDIAQKVLTNVLEWPDRKNPNVLQWAKMGRCWDHAKHLFRHVFDYKVSKYL